MTRLRTLLKEGKIRIVTGKEASKAINKYLGVEFQTKLQPLDRKNPFVRAILGIKDDT